LAGSDWGPRFVGFVRICDMDPGSIGGKRAAFGGGSFSPFRIAKGPKGGGFFSFWACGIGSWR
jgi:hypothetical protein